MAKEKGITLVTVPCWWDGKEERYKHYLPFLALKPLLSDSLAATITSARPDLGSFLPLVTAEPIPPEMPAGFKENTEASVVNIEDIGQPTTACFMTRSNVDPKGW